MRRDGTGVGVTRPFESSVTDQLVIGHAHAVRLAGCAWAKTLMMLLIFPSRKASCIWDLSFRGALPGLAHCATTGSHGPRGSARGACRAPVAVFPSQARPKLEFLGGVGVGAGFLDLFCNCFQSRFTISRRGRCCLGMLTPRAQEGSSFRCEGSMIDFSRLHVVVIQAEQPVKCSCSVAAGFEFSAPKVISTFLAGRAFAASVCIPLSTA